MKSSKARTISVFSGIAYFQPERNFDTSLFHCVRPSNCLPEMAADLGVDSGMLLRFSSDPDRESRFFFGSSISLRSLYKCHC